MNWYKIAKSIEEEKQRLFDLADINYMMALPDDCILEMTEEGKWRVYLTSGPPFYKKETMLVYDEASPKNAVKLAILRKLMEDA